MKRWKKITIGLVAGFLIVGAVLGIIAYSGRNVVAVETTRCLRQDLAAVVTASGEIKPKMYVNIGANAFGKITHLYVKEGERVRKGQLLAQIENVQPSADVAATAAGLEAARTDARAAQAGYKTALADLDRVKADYERTRLDWQRAQALYQEELIAKSEYDTRQNAWLAADAGLAESHARVAQAKAQVDSAERRVAQTRATLTHAADVLKKTTYAAPFDGIVTNLPVREGETVVIGIQNSPGSTLLTIADMSVITSEVKVDETDIVNVKLGQAAEVTIDAIPKQVFKGVVTEIGDNAIVRSTGLATSQETSSSQEAKDFKVVITLEAPPENLRPGLSSTGKITTATRSKVVTIPIQALTMRRRSDLESLAGGGGAVEAAAPQLPASKDNEQELQGVFVIRKGKADFVPVDTGISGTTDIEVVKGIDEGDEIVVGSYKVLRTMKPGSKVRIDNSEAKKEQS
ncbi:MAG: efflux RND transporter periplasmic adaptor subunit [Acidobacteria bacterium]|nr:efflux RND transporter periplasmic adaptor subunit [Acidobacteriota bacterium]